MLERRAVYVLAWGRGEAGAGTLCPRQEPSVGGGPRKGEEFSPGLALEELTNMVAVNQDQE